MCQLDNDNDNDNDNNTIHSNHDANNDNDKLATELSYVMMCYVML